MSNLDRMLFIAVFSVVAYLIGLGLGYAWMSGMHYPFTLRQRKMWTYYVLFISALPVWGPLTVAMALWLMPINGSMAIGFFLLMVWMIIAFYIVRRMSKPGGRLSEEWQDSK